MDIFDIAGNGAYRTGALGTALARIRERNQDMNKFAITRADLADMREIARVSSRNAHHGSANVGGQPPRWTELAIYHRSGHARPYIAVAEGKSSVPGESDRFQHMAAGTLERALNWFEGSTLRDELARAIPDDWAASPADMRAPVSRHDDAPFYRGPDRLTELLAWLYPTEQTDRALALAFEQDFGMGERTVRNILAIEAGRVDGTIGPWLKPLLAAMRYFDKRTWDSRKAIQREASHG